MKRSGQACIHEDLDFDVSEAINKSQALFASGACRDWRRCLMSESYRIIVPRAGHVVAQMRNRYVKSLSIMLFSAM